MQNHTKPRFKLHRASIILLLLAGSLAISVPFFDLNNFNYLTAISMVSIAIQVSLGTYRQKDNYYEVDNPFEVITIENNELVMGDARFNVNKVKEVIIQPSVFEEDNNKREVGLIVFARNHRKGKIPNLMFDITHISALQAFFEKHLPNTKCIQDKSYIPIPC